MNRWEFSMNRICANCNHYFWYGAPVFHSKHEYRNFICQKCAERENMPNIKITAEVDGKQVPLETISTETFEAIKALEKPKVPVARLATMRGRCKLIFKVTEQMAERKGQYVAIDLSDSHVTGHWSGSDDSDCGSGYGYDYENVQPL